MKKGQKLVRPHYKTMWKEAEAEAARWTRKFWEQVEGGKVAMDALAVERAANLRHRKIEIRLAVLDVALAAAMLYLLATR
jgi:hypothetical protein